MQVGCGISDTFPQSSASESRVISFAAQMPLLTQGSPAIAEYKGIHTASLSDGKEAMHVCDDAKSLEYDALDEMSHILDDGINGIDIWIRTYFEKNR